MKLPRSPPLRVSRSSDITVMATNMAAALISRTARVTVGLNVTGRTGGWGTGADTVSFAFVAVVFVAVVGGAARRRARVRGGRRGWPW
ncbi:hypothetical protein GCM10010331_72830 [Streptomyces xanthochromogenes]|nr:hypothetical protein GCM10010331_72830 [Streptomyces xanthochromogenes]